jgi:hypothetical protein
MPVHDWTRVPAGLFHDFHQGWSVRIADALNRGLPKGCCALIEKKVDGPEPGVIAVEKKKVTSDAVRYAQKANRISIHRPLGQVVAVIEIVSPGNKDSRHALRSFVDKSIAFLRNGIHLLVVDLFPPSDRDPQGVHKAVWDELADQPFAPPAGKDRTLVSYQVGDGFTAHIEPVGVGDPLPDMPLFLTPHEHVLVPLEPTYAATWAVCPEPIRELVESPAE